MTDSTGVILQNCEVKSKYTIRKTIMKIQQIYRVQRTQEFH